MGSGSSRSASDERAAAVRRERDPAATRLSLEEIMLQGRRGQLSWLTASNRGEILWEGEGTTSSRRLSSSELESSSNLAAAAGASASNSQSSPPCHMELDRVNLPSAGDATIRHVESEASGSRQPEALRGQQSSSVYVRRARNSTSSGTREEEAEGSRQPLYDERLHHACETTLQQRRMNEQLRHYAGLPSSISLEGGSFVLSDSSDSNHRTDVVLGAANQGLFASASGDTDADRSLTWPAPSLLQAWDQSNVWERSFVRGQSSAGPTLVRTSLSSGESSGVSAPETRRSSGRRLWDALSRGTFHRRTSTLTMAALADLEENSMPLGDVEQLVDTETLHGSRSLDLEERRRRVRSQVWALRRLSNGLDGTSWHARSCARNHHGHRCSCEGHDMGDDTDTRASISRIIMLAEALFEVLDEIHRQSMALSQSATVPLASRPASTSVVDAIPLRTHCKPVDDCDEAPQCYICLVEYEEGDSVRTLPCNHEYHKNCVDKWLTEIHGVCPLCRGNVCEPKAVDSGVEAAV
ncbi:unnamed protein product [Sphagnum compactum]